MSGLTIRRPCPNCLPEGTRGREVTASVSVQKGGGRDQLVQELSIALGLGGVKFLPGRYTITIVREGEPTKGQENEQHENA